MMTILPIIGGVGASLRMDVGMRHASDREFGGLRLLFATIVIIAHADIVATGDVMRDPLHRLIGVPAPTFAVYGFFLISGYVITSSFLKSRSVWAYLRNRVVRIYPAFVVASILCLVIVAPLGGATASAITASNAMRAIVHIMMLQPPDNLGAFSSAHVHELNVSMWTISYEFRCYLMIAVLGAAGALRFRWISPALAAIFLLGGLPPNAAFTAFDALPFHPGLFIGRSKDAFAFTGIFFVGSTLLQFRPSIPTNTIAATISLGAMIAGLAVGGNGAICAALAGPALLWAAERLVTLKPPLDISYGAYLYAWPISMLLVMYSPSLPPLAIITLSCLLAYLAGYASSRLVEGPMERRHKARRQTEPEGIGIGARYAV